MNKRLLDRLKIFVYYKLQLPDIICEREKYLQQNPLN